MIRSLTFRLLALCFFVLMPCTASAAQPLLATSAADKAAVAPGVSVEVNVLVTIQAPEIKPVANRMPVAVSLVLDRSGSMDEAKKMDYAIRAGKTLVRSLGPEDLFALTIYDSEVEVLYPLAPVTDKDRLIRMLDSITPRSTTFLSGGLEEGIAQLRGVRKEGPCRVILLSDGLANRGVMGVEQVAAIGAKARNTGVSVTTIGLGLDFNEDLMQLLAQRGGGQYYYIRDSEDLPSVFEQELGLIANSFTKDLHTTFQAAPGVNLTKIYGYSTTQASTPAGQETAVEMSDLTSGEARMLMLKLSLTPEAEGLQNLGTLKVAYTDQSDGSAQTMEIPVTLTVMADEAARTAAQEQHKEAISQVQAEVLLMDASEARIAAFAELEKGNMAGAQSILAGQRQSLAAMPEPSPEVFNMMDQLSLDEKNLSVAAHSPAMLQDLNKSSKADAFMSLQGSRMGIMLSLGDKGYLVEKLQNALRDKGFWTKDADGIYGPELEEAVKQFQESQSIKADGIAGPATQNALGI